MFACKKMSSLVVLLGITGILFTNLTSAQNCNPSLFNTFDEDAVEVCSMLYLKFEAALLVPRNLYKLRHAMFPNEKGQPLVVEISYSVIFEDISQAEPCAGADNHSLVDINHRKNISWTDVDALAILDPHVFDFLQPAILTLTSPIVRPYYTRNNPNLVSLVFQISDLECVPSQLQVNDVLDDLTTKAKAYAANTDPDLKLDSWDTAYRGYTINESTEFEYLFIFGPAIAMVVILSIIIFPLFYTSSSYFHEIKNSIEAKSGIYYRLYRSVFGIILMVNIIFYLSDAVCLGLIIFYHETNLEVPQHLHAIVGRFAGLVGSLCFSIFVAYTISVWIQIFEVKGKPGIIFFAGKGKNQITVERVNEDMEESTDYSNSLDQFLLFVCCCCKVSKNCQWKDVSHLLQIINFLAFIVFIAWNSIPVITLLFINPILTLAITSFAAVFFILAAITVTLPFILRDKQNRKWRRTRYQWPNKTSGYFRCCGSKGCVSCITYTCCWDVFWIALISVILFFFAMAVILTIYVKIIGTGVHNDGGFVGFVFAFIPTIITGVLAWLGKKVIFYNHGSEDNEQETTNSSDDHAGGEKVVELGAVDCRV